MIRNGCKTLVKHYYRWKGSAWKGRIYSSIYSRTVFAAYIAVPISSGEVAKASASFDKKFLHIPTNTSKRLWKF